MTSPPLSRVRWTSAVLLAALGAGTVRAGRRLRAVPVLPAAPPAAAGLPGAAGWRLLTAPGVVPDAATFLAARAYADREGLRVLDLLPADLEAERVLGLLRLVDPTGYRQDRLGEGRGAGFAVLVAEEALARAGVEPGGPRPKPAELMALVRRLKEYAAGATGLAIAPGLSCGLSSRPTAGPGPSQATGSATAPLVAAEAGAPGRRGTGPHGAAGPETAKAPAATPGPTQPRRTTAPPAEAQAAGAQTAGAQAAGAQGAGALPYAAPEPRGGAAGALAAANPSTEGRAAGLGKPRVAVGWAKARKSRALVAALVVAGRWKAEALRAGLRNAEDQGAGAADGGTRRAGPPRTGAVAGRARVAELRAQGLPPGAVSVAQLAGLALLGGVALRQGRWGAAAAGLYWLQPYLALGGPRSPLRPADLARATAARPVRSLRTALRTGLAAAGQGREDGRDTAATVAAAYRADLSGGTERFLEPRRPDCPWCGSDRLTVRVRVPDLLQGKPGRFTLERCGDCGHVFQNPRLTPEGLEFYYRDFYDGRGGEGAGQVFGRLGATYRRRAEMLLPYADPASWLDVGTGHGHFCNAARTVWPGTRFDGLDMGDGVLEAERRGWVEAGFRGQFPEYAQKLAGRYEVVSMYHYLEHTRDPLAELDAAAIALTPGGFLAIELPDPQSRMAALLGPAWLPWFQPQHQHLMPAANLREALADRGFTVLAEEHGPAHQGNDFFGAVALTATRLGPDPDRPWGPPATTGARVRAGAVRAAAVPCFAAAAVLDALRTAAARATDGGNAYRMLARKDTR
ncbi:methyltransferase family protein [Streptomyces sp. Ag109_G2-6]|uniref:class I SAM-dependent methyltransferase n=1 Tax=Streptomyces TaxID=1883 RepID=UPI000FA758FC|nr:methyltransferase domain-containing protein [Streptomyces sp. Ag109_G2-6]RPF29844.1 methyltransferase family protein [Streptomyces sp. Ag109_G2-6]